MIVQNYFINHLLKRGRFILFVFIIGCIVPSLFGQKMSITSGPMVGSLEMRSVVLWLQTGYSVDVYIEYFEKGKKNKMQTSVFQTQQKDDYTVHIPIGNLMSGTAYSYYVYVNGEKQTFRYELGFTTQPHWQYRSDPPNFSVAIGSCLFINDKLYDRPGKPYGGDPGILQTIAKKQPEIMLWLGDNLYFREPEFYSSIDAMSYRYRYVRSLKEIQELLSGSVHLAIWDDHDYGPNNSDKSYRMKYQSLEIFKRYWANPSYGLPTTPGVFTYYKYGDIDFFLLDNRFYRSPNLDKRKNKDHLGRQQLEWLKDHLLSSSAPFKIIALGGQVTNINGRHERFSDAHDEYVELMDFLDVNNISGVIFLSGDRHFTELLKTERDDNLYPLYEFTSSPLSSGSYSTLNKSKEYNNPLRVEGTLVYKQRNFGMLHFKGERKNRMLTMETYDPDGSLLWSYDVKATELVSKY